MVYLPTSKGMQKLRFIGDAELVIGTNDVCFSVLALQYTCLRVLWLLPQIISANTGSGCKEHFLFFLTLFTFTQCCSFALFSSWVMDQQQYKQGWPTDRCTTSFLNCPHLAPDGLSRQSMGTNMLPPLNQNFPIIPAATPIRSTTTRAVGLKLFTSFPTWHEEIFSAPSQQNNDRKAQLQIFR